MGLTDAEINFARVLVGLPCLADTYSDERTPEKRQMEENRELESAPACERARARRGTDRG